MAIEICCPQGVDACAQNQPRCNPGLCGTYGQPCCSGNYQCDEGMGCLSLTVIPNPPPVIPPGTTPQSIFDGGRWNWCMPCGQALNLPPSLNNIELDKIVQPCCKNNQCDGTCYDVEVVAPENADFQSAKMENVCLSEQMKTLAEFYSNRDGAVITFTERPTSIIPGVPNYAIGIGAVAIVGIFALMWI